MAIDQVLARAALAVERFADNLGRQHQEQNPMVKLSAQASLLEKPGYDSPKQVNYAHSAVANNGSFGAATQRGVVVKLLDKQPAEFGAHLNLAA